MAGTETRTVNLFINTKGASASIKELTNDERKLRNEIALLSPGTDAFIQKSKQLKQVKDRLKEVKDQANVTRVGIGEMTDKISAMGPVGRVIGNIKNGFGELVQGIGIGLRFVATFSGALMAIPIIAFIAAIASLVAWFTKTEEGAEMLERIFAGMGAFMNVLWGLLGKVGKALVDVFKNPKQAAVDLVDFLAGQVINRFTALLDILIGIATLDFEQTSEGLLQMATGVKDVTGKAKELSGEISKVADEAARAAEETMELKRQMQDIEDAERDLSVTNEKRKGQIDELLLKTKERTLSEKERLKALAEAGALEKAMTEDALKLAKARVENIQKEQAIMKRSGVDPNDDEKDKLANAQKEMIALENQSASIRQTIKNKESVLIKELSDQRKKEREDRQKAEEDVLKNIKKLELDSMTDSFGNRIKKLRIQADEEIKLLKGTEEQKALQRQLIEKKLNQDIKKIQDEKSEQVTKEIQEQLDAELEAVNKNEIAKAELAVLMAGENGDLLLQMKIKRLQTEKDIELQNKKLTEEEKLLIEEKFNQDAAALKEERQAQIEEQNREEMTTKLDLVSQGVGFISDFSTIKNQRELMEAEATKQRNLQTLEDEQKTKLKKLQEDLEAKRITEEQFNQFRTQMDNERKKAEADGDEKTRAIKRKQAEGEKRASIAQALIAIPLSIIKAMPNVFLAGIAGVVGALNLAKIIATPLPQFGTGGSTGRAMRGLRGRYPTVSHGGHIDQPLIAEFGEKGPEYVVNNDMLQDPWVADMVGIMEGIRTGRGGRRGFADGGSTLESDIRPGSTDNTEIIFSNILLEMRAFRADMANWKTKIEAFIVYDTLNDTLDEVDTIKEESKIQ